ncbi:MAG TPA: cupin domain-containing protein [Oligoflexus sp.]|uniref:cupin domain-containing protein n=1 Tax=Oligoflexus sp. TaxID=1971216 RepID=UPI002D7EFFE0|nr:cupin domain-containing protein [Oligoflexus sp.]HET9239589.1 cupin domain-containing protein [Oligoflexus sp.]
MPVLSAPSGPTHALPGTTFTSLATPTRGTVCNSLWKVEIQPGTVPTAHQVTREEIFVILAGSAQVRIADETALAKAGDVIVVPPHTSFEVSCHGSEPLQALCCLPVGGEARLKDGTTFIPPWAL